MARKSKRMTLNDAIRQGQAKIEEGLKTGQMRSDGPSVQRADKDRVGFLSPESGKRSPAGKSGVFFLKSKENSPKGKWVVLLCAAVAVVVVLVLGKWLNSPTETEQPVNQEPRTGFAAHSGENDPENTDRSPGFKSGGELLDSDDIESPEKETPPPPSGNNVIWVQRIPLSQKDELAPVADFFSRKGIETEIIVRRDKDDAILVTKAGFEENPVKKGTDGYKLLQRIKQLGPVYVKETEDTKFGVKPFQDALGYKR